MANPTSSTIAVIGLGYVGLPLAVKFGERQRTIGLDLSREKVEAYRRHVDPTGEVSGDDLRAAVHLHCTTDPAAIAEADVIIVAVPTPVDEARRPDFTPLIKSSESVGRHMKRGAIVVYESTVYPGATEEVCIPVILRAAVGPEVEGRTSIVGYSARAHQPRRPGTHADASIVEDGVGRHARDAGHRGRGCTAASSRPACTRPPASRWPRPPR